MFKVTFKVKEFGGLLETEHTTTVDAANEDAALRIAAAKAREALTQANSADFTLEPKAIVRI